MELLHAIEARYLATPLAEALTVDLRRFASKAERELIDGGFTQAPVTHSGKLVGWVSLERLAGCDLVSDAYTDLTGSRFCGSAASINDLLPHLAETGFCFVVGRGGIDSIVVPSDVDRHAARSHFYNLVAGVEIAIADLIRREIDPGEVASWISDRPQFGGGGSLRQTFDEAKQRGVETHPVEYL